MADTPIPPFNIYDGHGTTMNDIAPINTFESHGTTVADIPRAAMMFYDAGPMTIMSGIPQTAMFNGDIPPTDTADGPESSSSDDSGTSPDDSVARNVSWVHGLTRTLLYCPEAQYESGIPSDPVSKVNLAKLITASGLFRRLLKEHIQEKARKPANNRATIVQVNFDGVLPEVLGMMIFWVETRQVLEMNMVESYTILADEEESSPWMTLVLLYLAALKFEMPGLKDAVTCKVADVVLATKTVPYVTLKSIYSGTTPGDPLRRLMIDIVASMGTSKQYWQHILSWNQQIYWDLLIAVKDNPAQTPEFATRLQDYLVSQPSAIP